MVTSNDEIVWTPADDCWQTTRMGRFISRVSDERKLQLTSYEKAWEWSIKDLEGFWSEIVREFEVSFSSPPEEVLRSESVASASWFPGSTLNYTRSMLEKGADTDVAVIGESQSRPTIELTFGQLRDQVRRMADALRSLGVRQGDRVAAYLPNCPEAIVAFLASASLGAIWSSCAPEFGVRAVIDRFSQINPKVLFAVTGYRFGTKEMDRSDDLRGIVGALPTLEQVVILDYFENAPSATSLLSSGPAVTTYPRLLETDGAEELQFAEVPFDHPLYVLYSSGSTGLPKPIVHSHGGILLEHLKALGLHHDIGSNDTFFWFTTNGWMMWNFLVSALALGSTVVAFDGDPAHPALDETFRIAARTGTTVLGCGSPYLATCASAGLDLPDDIDLSALVQIGATGSPLPPSAFEWAAEQFHGRVQIASISGGTDVCTAVVGGSPLLPVRTGEITCRLLGAWVDAFDESGASIVGALGEMVIRAPMPSMPVGFWNDDDGSRIKDAYFNHFPDVWRHGDWIQINTEGGCIISGRSDATLNRGGIRSGTAEYSAAIESIAEVTDSIVVHIEDPDGGVGELVLLVSLQDGARLDTAGKWLK